MGAMASQITSLTIVYSTVWRRSKKTSKLRVTGLCAENSLVTGEFPAQMAGDAENVSTWWRHNEDGRMIVLLEIPVLVSKLIHAGKGDPGSKQAIPFKLMSYSFAVYRV